MNLKSHPKASLVVRCMIYTVIYVDIQRILDVNYSVILDAFLNFSPQNGTG
ncbi:hypothetical protein SBF1_2290005 [Candidatus Desulfosporosinus infrequens]|uniref:Uncharacterized protein n=1 Tax=Candidatus Desulfosporosinus infrequens TaxID=2043169 RepID=A0A2U3KLX2_9FIRM|nr:hypothetical protein SBF1_2290005 [Candidatus Desulfosporosinus infrequens]